MRSQSFYSTKKKRIDHFGKRNITNEKDNKNKEDDGLTIPTNKISM